MRNAGTIRLRDVRKLLRQGNKGRLMNASGWCVFLEVSGRQRYVIDDEKKKPLPYIAIRPMNEPPPPGNILSLFQS